MTAGVIVFMVLLFIRYVHLYTSTYTYLNIQWTHNKPGKDKSDEVNLISSQVALYVDFSTCIRGTKYVNVFQSKKDNFKNI